MWMPDVAAFENNRPLGLAPGWCDKEGPPVAADDAVLHGDRPMSGTWMTCAPESIADWRASVASSGSKPHQAALAWSRRPARTSATSAASAEARAPKWTPAD